MTRRTRALALLSAGLAACAVGPIDEQPASAPEERPVVAVIAPKSVETQRSPLELLEERHRARAEAYAREGDWAEALVQWEVLLLLRPRSQAYRDAIAETRTRIANITAGLMRAAQLAHKQENFDQATVLYLRVLYFDRDNAAAAQALREIDAERNRRAYANRPPRMRM